MITFENTQVVGLEPAIRGMRNPMNSWEKSDSGLCDVIGDSFGGVLDSDYRIGPADRDLMMRLAAGGPVHAKYRRMITVYVDITAPLYWWKEFDTYKVGTVANSCSTMHKIHAKKFELDDFSYEHLDDEMTCLKSDAGDPYEVEEWTSLDILKHTIAALNYYRTYYLKILEDNPNGTAYIRAKEIWWQMIQLLPSSYNQKRTVMLNYEVLAGIYPMRKDHKLDEWHEFCRWIEQLPYSELITGIGPKDLTGTDVNSN